MGGVEFVIIYGAGVFVGVVAVALWLVILGGKQMPEPDGRVDDWAEYAEARRRASLERLRERMAEDRR